ncbi:MAG: glycosyltransferase family 4 protein [Ignavibacteriales bacterium]|nr:glycosyltransferase family 4 protein [Ignavibacteriales bacterium]
MKKVLIVTYFWPPAGGPGVQRVLKFVKYLPNFGWQPIILTVANGEYAAVDPTLEKNIPKNIRVYKTKYIEPFSFYKKFLGIKNEQNIPTAVLAENTTNRKQKVANWIRLNIFIPDAKIGWKYFAVKEGLKIIKSERPNLIYSSSPPPTVHLIAKSLSQKTKLQWIADFRDPWTDIHYYENQKRLEISKNLDLKLEKNVLQEADKITCISQLDIEEDFGKKTDIGKCINIPNGYDEEDFYDLNTNRTNKNIFTLLHLGAVNSERNPIGLFEALKNLKQNKFIDSSVFQFVFVGKVENVIKETITEFEIEDLISFIDYLPHQQALKYLEEAAMLILLITNSEKNRRILPGKTFEYLRAQKFVLGLGPTDGEVSRIINKVQSGEVVNYADKVKIEKIIKQQFNSWHRDLLDYISSKEVIAQYNRENLTKKLANIFDELIIKK